MPQDLAEALYDQFYAAVFRKILLITADPQTAADATQEGFLRAFVRFDKLRSADSFERWVTVIALNVVRERARKRWREFLVDPATAVSLDRAHFVDPFDAEASSVLTDVVRSLPLELREVVLLYYYDEFKVGEIARALRIPAGTVKSRLARARAMLKARLDLG